MLLVSVAEVGPVVLVRVALAVQLHKLAFLMMHCLICALI